MKILHTGDWHIGKLVHGIHMTLDQKYILEQFKDLVREEKPDVVIIAGDLYDRSIPPVEAVELLDSVLSEILKNNEVKIMAIAGNHDSPDRVSFASEILKDRGLYIEGVMKRGIEPISLEDEHGKINFYLIPYAEPAVVRELYEDQEIKTPDQAMKAILENLDFRAGERNICVAHGFVSFSEDEETNDEMRSESERPLIIGGSEIVSVDYFEKFDYVALGHLHRPQKIKHEYIRYSGSLMKYSFNEHRQKKSVTMVEIDAHGKIEYEFREFKPLRDMRIIRGPIDDLLSEDVYIVGNREDYIKAELMDSGEIIDPIGKLREVYPNVLSVERIVGDRDLGNIATSAGEEFSKKNPVELFGEFYKNVSDDEFTEEKEEIIAEISNEVLKNERNV